VFVNGTYRDLFQILIIFFCPPSCLFRRQTI